MSPSKKCYVGLPFEFSATYDGVIVKKDFGPDTSPVYGLVMKNLKWLAPKQVSIGKGFSVKPDLPYGIVPPFGAAAANDLELVVTGPGLPAAGHRVKPKWGLSSCLSAAPNIICKQFMQLEVVKSKSGASEFTIEFVGGYTEQQFTKGSNTATWRICYEGPFELLRLAPLPNPWELWWIVDWPREAIGELKEAGASPGAELSVEPPVVTMEAVSAQVAEASVPHDLESQRRDLLGTMEGTVSHLREAEALALRSNEAASDEKRLELRAAAIDRLQQAQELSSQAIALLSRLEEMAEGRS